MYNRKPDFEADLATAMDPETSDKQLQKLLEKHYGEEQMADAVARHPNCPFRLFVTLYRWQVPGARHNPMLERHSRHQHWEDSARRNPRRDYSKYNWDISKAKPQAYQLNYVMEHGEGAYQRWAITRESIPEALIRDHIDSKSAPLRKAIATRSTLPDDLFERLAGDRAKSVRQTVAANRCTPPELIGRLASDKEAAVAEAARANPKCPEQALQLAKLAAAQTAPAKGSGTLMERLRQAVDPQLSDEQLGAYTTDEEPCVRFQAGLNPSASPEQLTRLATDSVAWVRCGPAFNPNTPPQVLTQLLEGADCDLQLALAGNPSLAEAEQLRLAEGACDVARKTLADLTQHPSVWERLAGGVDPDTPPKKRGWRHTLAEALALRSSGKFYNLQRSYKTRYLFVSRIAARCEHTSDNLARHYAHYLFEDYARNPKAALALLEGKTHVQPTPYQEWKLDKWLSEGDAPGHVSYYYIRSDHPKRSAQAISNWSTPVPLLLPFLTDPKTQVRKRLAQRRDLPRCCFEILARDEKPGVRETVAANKKTPKELLSLLAGDQSTTVEDAAGRRRGKAKKKPAEGVANRGTATDRARLAKRSEEPKLLAELAADRAASVRNTVAQNRHCPPEVHDQLATDKEAKVRISVAERSRDPQLLTSLLDDTDAGVRVAAAKNGHWRRYVDRNYRYDQEFLALIADAPDPDSRAIAARYAESPDLYRRYLNEESVVVLRELGQNRFLSPEFKLELAHKVDDQDTVAHLAYHTDDQELFLIAAAKITSVHADDPIRCHREMLSRPEVQDALCRHPVSNIRYALANQPRLTAKARAALAEDEYKEIRRRVADKGG